LRERMGDVEELSESFLAKYSPNTILSGEALKDLLQHDWPGNVRELRNVIERSSIVVGGGQEILGEHIIL